jgi:hypothetical protein
MIDPRSKAEQNQLEQLVFATESGSLATSASIKGKK